MNTEKSAKGTRGFLLKDINGRFFFRVYESEDKSQFTDYGLGFSDMEIEITDNFIALYKKDNDSHMLDYTSKVLGR